MMTLAFTGLEKALYGYLKLDPDTMARFAKLAGKIIHIRITDWNIDFFVLPQVNGIKLAAKCDDVADTTIAGKLFDLFNVGCARGNNQVLFTHAIDISGDSNLGESIRNILAQVDIDWEEHLAKMVGDVVAHKVGVGVRRTIAAGRRTGQILRTNVKEYLQQETQQIPSATQLEEYVQDVAMLRNDVERAAARLNRLMAKRNEVA